MEKKILKNNLIKILFFIMFLSIGVIFSVNFFSSKQIEFAVANETIDESGYIQPQTSEKEAVGEPAVVSITSISPVDRVYDGTNVVNLEITIDLSDEGLSVTGTGTVSTADIGEGKAVTVDTQSLQLLGGSIDDYTLSTILPAGSPTVTISKKPVTFNWGIVGNQSTFTYTGEDLKDNISPYYTDINNVSHSLNFSIVGNSFIGRAYSPNDFIKPGNYVATIITLESDLNYSLTDSNHSASKSLSISRINPVFSFSRTSFTYTGQEFNLANYVSVNNSEQTVKFSSETTRFTTYLDGQSLSGVSVYVEQSENYNSKNTVFPFTMSKAQCVIDLSNFPTEYIYNGQEQTIDSNLISINNSEQVVSVAVNDGRMLLNAGSYTLTIQTTISSNYNAYFNNNFDVEIAKKTIDVSLFSWQSTTSFTYEKNRAHTVALGTSSTEVTPVYGGVYSATNAGVYVAEVSSFVLTDSENCEVTGTVEILIWSINKRVQSIPRLTSQTSFTYDGEEKQVIFSIMSNTYLSVSNYSATNAGDYLAKISLNDANSIWNDYTVDSIFVSWSIEKAVIAIPQTTGNPYYTGEEQLIPLAESPLYEIIDGSGNSVGEYTSYLILTDTANYVFEGSEKAYVAINWAILEIESHQEVSYLAVIIGVAVVIIGGLFLTLQFTINRRRKRKRHAEIMNAEVQNRLKKV